MTRCRQRTDALPPCCLHSHRLLALPQESMALPPSYRLMVLHRQEVFQIPQGVHLSPSAEQTGLLASSRRGLPTNRSRFGLRATGGPDQREGTRNKAPGPWASSCSTGRRPGLPRPSRESFDAAGLDPRRKAHLHSASFRAQPETPARDALRASWQITPPSSRHADLGLAAQQGMNWSSSSPTPH